MPRTSHAGRWPRPAGWCGTPTSPPAPPRRSLPGSMRDCRSCSPASGQLPPRKIHCGDCRTSWRCSPWSRCRKPALARTPSGRYCRRASPIYPPGLKCPCPRRIFQPSPSWSWVCPAPPQKAGCSRPSRRWRWL